MSRPAKPPKPAIIVVVADAEVRERVRAELDRRYRRDYEILCTNDPAAVLPKLEGKTVAVILAEQWLPGTTGVELLTEARTQHPHAKRALLVDWGAWADAPTAEAIVTAMALGQIDYYVLKPWRVRTSSSTGRSASSCTSGRAPERGDRAS